MNIGERIKARRKELGLSVDEVAKKLNKNRATIYRYESNDIENLPVNILEPLAIVLNTTPACLMGWSEDLESNKKVFNEFDKNHNNNFYERKLLNSFNKLNDDGKDEAIKRVEELTELSKYKKETVNKDVELPKEDDEFTKVLEARKRVEEYFKENPHLMPIASHDKDGDFTEEDYKHDEDIMKNDDLWK
ncbi:MAG: helix-turn-helix domain-containing protein [Clostridium sp.]|uniref:helix-turn-helix domain-containing protein n=1 Tax=Clostridium sp. TaxID=1506 RepID=UPI002A74D2FF|nr:helix-turn-helix domain-containing protein [Clostridium sp.]MDY2632409.1 helix-turn-helix domain-containing protein [Clostridium sp.]